MSDREQGDRQRTGESSGHRPLSSGDLTSSWALDEFFESLGTVMRLPPKPKDAAPESRQAAIAVGGRRARLLMTAAVGLLALVAFQGPLRHLLAREARVPAAWFGTWRTDAPRYADRAFVISEDTIRLQLGPGVLQSFPILGGRWAGEAGARNFIIQYQDASGPLELALHENPDSSLSLASLPTVSWRRE
jgi:hypothetical protein